MKNELVGISVAVVCAIVMIGTVLVPFINDTVDGNVTTYTNEGTGTFTINGTEDYTIYNTDGQTWVINGESVDVGSYKGPLVTTDVFVFLKSDVAGKYMFLRDADGGLVEGGSANTYLFEIEYTAETNTAVYTKYTDLTGDTVDTTYTYSCSHVIEYDSDGDYIGYTTDGGSSVPVDYYVNSLDQVVAGGAYISGELDTAYFARGESVTLGNESYTATATATTENVLSDVLNVSTYTITVTDGTDTESFTPYTIYVPATVEGHTTEQTTINTLYGIIPLFTILTVLCAVVYAVMRNRD